MYVPQRIVSDIRMIVGVWSGNLQAKMSDIPWKTYLRKNI